MTTASATAIRLDLDLESGRITAPGRTIGLEALQPNLQALLADEGKEFAVIVLSKGDRRPLDLALLADHLPREVDLLTLKVALKEFETGRRYDIHEGDGTAFTAITRDGLPRYRTMLAMVAAQMQRILRNYADPSGTFVHLIGEIETQYRYNAGDYSPAVSYTEAVATGSQTVYVPIPLTQANGTRAYKLSVIGSVQPDGLGGGWGSNPIYILNQAISITVSGGAVVGANLTIPAGTQSASASPSRIFVPHWLTSMDPIRVDPITGGLNLRVDVVSSPMSTTTFGAMPTTVWRAEKVPFSTIWTNGYYYNFGAPDVVTFRDATGASLGSHTMTYGYAAPASISHSVGAFNLFVGRGNNYTTDFVWKTEPTAKFVRTASGQDIPVVETPVPTGPTIRFDVTLVAEGDEEAAETTRVTSQSFVVQLRRDLIPDVAPDSGGS